MEATLLTLGVILVVVGLIGQVKAKEIEIGTTNPLVRVILGLLGVAFVFLALQDKILPVSPTPTPPNPTVSATTPPTPTDVTVPTPTTPPPTPTDEMPVFTNETFVSDNQEGQNPDFQTLVIRYNDELVRITIAMNGIDSLAGQEFIYMYGTYRDLIRLNSGDFRLERDYGADGHFEELIYSGSIEVSGSSISISVPISYLPDISQKRIWGYSMQSQDRIPNEGELRFP